jgi:spore coat polysaccharide biosynthesis predicted glycosyltransferase SpsG
LISFGGTDDGTYAAPAAEALLMRLPDVVANVVLSPLAAGSDLLEQVRNKSGERLRIHHGANMPRLMAMSTHYVGAAGVTLMEAIASDLNFVVCALADNQLINIRTLSRLGYPAFAHFQPQAMASTVADNPSPSKGPVFDMIDGRGGGRVVSAICDYLRAPARPSAIGAVR